MNRDDVLKHEKRKKIYDFILNHPGLHFGSISRELKMPKTTLNYHLKSLVKNELILKQKKGRYHRYYLAQKVSNFDKNILNIFRQEVPRDIVLYLIVYAGATQTELSHHLEKHPTTIEFHLKKLMDMDLVERLSNKNGKIIIPRPKKTKYLEYTPISNDVIFILKDPVKMYETLLFHKNSFIKDKKVKATITLIEDSIKTKNKYKIPKKTKKDNSNEDNLFGTIFDLFPIPWCA